MVYTTEIRDRASAHVEAKKETENKYKTIACQNRIGQKLLSLNLSKRMESKGCATK